MSQYPLPLLPLQHEVESKVVLKKLALAHKALAELNGVAETIPNEVIILNTLSLQEAKDSSAIENIITTHDELFSSDSIAQQFASSAAKEVYNYASALKEGFSIVREKQLITCNHIIEIQSVLEETKSGFRKLPGTALKNGETGETVYTPPQNHDEIIALMSNLETFMNDDTLTDIDALVKMAIIHHQFESIHPFYDGNGRTGRIINILYLVKEDLLHLPILYLSRYINQNKGSYYHLLQETRITQNWEPWILFILEAVEQTSIQTTGIIRGIKKLMMDYKQKIRTNLPKIYSQDLINNLFKHPYTKIDFLVQDLDITRQTASKYLDQLIELKLVTLHKIGKENFYINTALYDFLHNAPQQFKFK
ncbi:Adenosine monophosphate-protein transferase SoFic [Flavobacterium sp. ACN2]|jgi:Fic family protein|uniref:Fic family protein n=1 Tax=Flavobacterium sp. ACN2 TaxID=1975676 RepID=UPI000BB31522|nr:Fic family protein [Flavobacterium sp. ACN2]PBI89620.1 Adenosine monophosphate-protein transferase SoFic [Flavobacterium sp. ACN2]